MRAAIRKRPLPIALIIILLALLAVVLNEFVRESIAPVILVWLWRVSIMSSGIPQVIIWALFIATIPIFAIFSLIQGRGATEDTQPAAPERNEGQVQLLARWIQQAPEGDYFYMRLRRYLSNLAVDTLAYRERLTPQEAKEMLQKGQLPVTSELRDYLLVGLRMHGRDIERTGPFTLAMPAHFNQTNGRHEPEIETLIQFLESELEVEGDH